MQFQRYQNTIQHNCQVGGRGYWSGRPIQLTFLPADPDAGICFVRTDLPGQPRIRAVTENRQEMSLRTRLRENDAEVDMVEHVMAALYALQIDNVLVMCDGPEMPGLDGSALAIALAIRQAGIEKQNSYRQARVITSTERIGDSRQYLAAYPTGDHRLHLEYRLDFGPGQTIPSGISGCILSPACFMEDIAAARTFISEKDAAYLQQQGLARHVTDRDLLVFGEQGPINNTLRYPDECARHKLLDLIGDLALCGYDICGRIIACRSGHSMNGRMADKIRFHSSEIHVAAKAA